MVQLYTAHNIPRVYYLYNLYYEDISIKNYNDCASQLGASMHFVRFLFTISIIIHIIISYCCIKRRKLRHNQIEILIILIQHVN